MHAHHIRLEIGAQLFESGRVVQVELDEVSRGAREGQPFHCLRRAQVATEPETRQGTGMFVVAGLADLRGRPLSLWRPRFAREGLRVGISQDQGVNTRRRAAPMGGAKLT